MGYKMCPPLKISEVLHVQENEKQNKDLFVLFIIYDLPTKPWNINTFEKINDISTVQNERSSFLVNS